MSQSVSKKVSQSVSWSISNNYDLARAKSEALVNNNYKEKRINHVMLKGDGNENGIKIKRSNQQKKKTLHVQHTFFLMSKKKFAHFCLSLSLFCMTTMPFCTTKMSDFIKLYSLFSWRNCRTCLPKILFPVFMFAFIFSLPLIFTWLLTLSSPLLFLFYPSECKHQK